MRLRSLLGCLLAGLVAACSEAGPVAPASGSADARVPEAIRDASAGSASDARADARTEARTDAEAPPDVEPSWPLGMNDVTILTPLPRSASSPVLLLGVDTGDDGSSLVPRELFDRLNEGAGAAPVLPADYYDRLHLVAVRFDLCDRNLPGPCAPGDDGLLRLVWQPMVSDTEFFDAGLHAFYSISSARLPLAIAALRRLARIQAEPVSSPLKPSPALSDPTKSEYARGLRAFVREHAAQAAIVRLTLNAQPAMFAEVRWVLRGLELGDDGALHDISIPGSSATTQDVIFRGMPGYEAKPVTDVPTGLVGALSQRTFEAADRTQQTSMLEALLAVDNPLESAPGTVSCVACHASTVLLDARSQISGMETQSLRGGYETSYNVSVDAGKLASSPRTLRALGYLARDLMISRRVANETAQVLTEIEQRFAR